MWFWKRDDVAKNNIKQLKNEMKELESQKVIIEKNIEIWHFKFDSLEIISSDLYNKNLKLEQMVLKAEENARKSKSELIKVKSRVDIKKGKIEEFKRNPSDRTGDDLLKSIKNKTKQ
jgi:hypothetical protein